MTLLKAHIYANISDTVLQEKLHTYSQQKKTRHRKLRTTQTMTNKDNFKKP